METIIEDTMTNHWYCVLMTVVFALFVIFGDFTGLSLVLMTMMCVVWGVGALAFSRLHRAAKRAQMLLNKRIEVSNHEL